jgi:hypothetical protein
LDLRPPPEAFETGKIIAILGKQGTKTREDTHGINFEYVFFQPMMVTHDVIEQYLVVGDLDTIQVHPTFVAVTNQI